MLLVALSSLGCGGAERGETGEIETAGSVDAFALRVGDCFDDWPLSNPRIGDVLGVPCVEPHDYEVFAVFDLATRQWPGQESVDAAARQGCGERFASSVGVSNAESVLAITRLSPTERSWDELGDREVVCAAFRARRQKLTGSVLNGGP